MIEADESKEQSARLRFHSDRAQIPVVVERIMGLVRASGCVKGEEIQVELALREALENAFVHGNHLDAAQWIQVGCRCNEDDGVSIDVRDEGTGFDPRSFAPATSRELPWHGVGLLIMRSYMDEVSFGQGGAEVHLRKRPCSLAPADGPLLVQELRSGQTPAQGDAQNRGARSAGSRQGLEAPFFERR